MKTLSKIVAVFGLLALSTSVLGDSPSGTSTDALDEAGVNYIQVTTYKNGVEVSSKLIVLRTKRTTEAVDSLGLESTEVVDLGESFEAKAAQRLRDQRRNERKN